MRILMRVVRWLLTLPLQPAGTRLCLHDDILGFEDGRLFVRCLKCGRESAGIVSQPNRRAA